MGRTDLFLLEATFFNRFPTIGLFDSKNGRKGNFLRKIKKLSLWSLHVLFSLVVQGAMMSKMMGRFDLMLFKAMFPNSFPTAGLFDPKNGRNGNFLRKNKEFSLFGLDVLVSPGV